jgi:hypothetical protein
MLGLDPYVLIEVMIKPGDEPDDVTFRFRAGGGIDTNDEAASVLASTLLLVLGKDDIGPEWAGVLAALEAMPDADDPAVSDES